MGRLTGFRGVVHEANPSAMSSITLTLGHLLPCWIGYVREERYNVSGMTGNEELV
jgi:hypothetical protein